MSKTKSMEELFSECESLIEIKRTASTLRAASQDPEYIRRLNNEVAKARKRLVMQVAPVDSLVRVLPKASVSQNGVYSHVKVLPNNLKSAVITMQEDTFVIG